MLNRTGVNCWIDFYSRIQLHILLSHNQCFFSFLYLDLFELRDDTSIGKGYLLRAKHIFVLIHILNKGELGTV